MKLQRGKEVRQRDTKQLQREIIPTIKRHKTATKEHITTTERRETTIKRQKQVQRDAQLQKDRTSSMRHTYKKTQDNYKGPHNYYKEP